VLTQKQLASELIALGGDRAAMQRAYNLDPWNPLVHLAFAEFEEDPEAADWLRRYSLDRLSNDLVLERQAADMLRKQHQPVLALKLIDRALKHTPQDPAACASDSNSGGFEPLVCCAQEKYDPVGLPSAYSSMSPTSFRKR
jgi:hypothetical protein